MSSLGEKIVSLPLFRTFTPGQIHALEEAVHRESTLRIAAYAPGQTVCVKGQYQLELCVVLRGTVEALDEVAEGRRVAVASFSVGDFFGELGALGGLPRTTDVVAATEAEILHVPSHALKYLEANSEARKILTDRYRERAIRVVANQIDLFEGVPESFIAELIPRCEIQRHDLRGLIVVKQGELADSLYIVRDGFVQVVRDNGDGSHRVLAYLRSGDYFGEMGLFESQVRYASVLTAGKCELIRIPHEDALELCNRYPQVAQRIRTIIVRRHEEEQRITPELSDLLEKSGQLGIIQSDALLVIDTDLCVNCDSCVRACESLHGESRLIRNGIQIGKYLIPSACRHCNDPKCMNSCPTGAIKRRPGGEIYFDYDQCIGCGNCAIACPFDNIAMIDAPTFDHAQARKSRMVNKSFFRPYPLAAHDAVDEGWWKRLLSARRNKRKPVSIDPPPDPERYVPPSFPIKCDLCDGLPFMGCVHNCPTGAAIRIDAAELFRGIGAVRTEVRIRKASGTND
jgi:CRP-like cAMP-binding protein/Fe-S-cluster-containing hydrogenase component 2